MDLDAAGGAISAGLIAGAVERPKGDAGQAHTTCADCGQATFGKFCSNCGQPTHVHRTLLHLGEELLHGVMHFDARIWRTLPLLALNPGRLTREWVQGKRSRYVSPLAMFLFTVFLMFFILSFGGGAMVNINAAPLDQRLAESRTALAEAKAELTSAEAAAKAGKLDTDADVIGAKAAVGAAEGVLRALQEAKAAAPRADGLAPGSWQAELADAAHDGKVKVSIGNKKMQDKILHKLSNPDLALYKVQQTVYKYAFLLIPLSIPFMALLFLWKPGFTLYDHGVFVLYSLTFMALLAMVLGALGRWEGWFVETLATLGLLSVPVHMFAQMKGAYSLSVWSALWRTFLLLNFCTVVLTLFLTAIILLGLGV